MATPIQRGFTLVELVGILVIVGILAVVAAPRFFNRGTYDARAFYDQAQAMLRYAQKLAVAQNAPVYVRLNNAGVAVCFDSDCSRRVPAPSGRNGGSKSTLAACSGDPNWLCEGVPPGVASSAANVVFYFDGLGRPFNKDDTAFNSELVLSITGDATTRRIVVERETGYVHM